jgi:hypothetical protein
LDIAHIGISLNDAILLPGTHFRNIQAWRRLNVLTLQPILASMAKKPEPPLLSTWDIFKIAKKSAWLGSVEAPDKAAAIEKVAQEFNRNDHTV